MQLNFVAVVVVACILHTMLLVLLVVVVVLAVVALWPVISIDFVAAVAFIFVWKLICQFYIVHPREICVCCIKITASIVR